MNLAVVGDPIHHSRSPLIHTAALAAFGLDGTYVARRVPRDGFAAVVRDLTSGILDGVNVTMPHKDHAFAAAGARSPAAERTRAVNTLVRGASGLEGHNTDVDGVRHALRLVAPPTAGVVVLGTGAAARAAVVAATGPVTVMGRSPERAAATLRTTGTSGDILEWGARVHGAVVVNATPLGMRAEALPESVLSSAGGLVDMAYGDEETPAIARARAHGLPFADGIDMLVGQAAAAFTLFTGRPAPMETMERAARR